MDQFSGEGTSALPTGVSVGEALLALLRHPLRQVVLRWNGKAALLSAMIRGLIFLIASVKSHHPHRESGVLAEAVFGAVSAGFFATLTQALRFAEPEWAAEWLLAVVFPLAFQVGDIYFHAALGSQKFVVSMWASAIFTIFSALFNLYIMRRGTLLVGDEGRPFEEDLGALPRLAWTFFVSGVVKCWHILTWFFRPPSRERVSTVEASPE